MCRTEESVLYSSPYMRLLNRKTIFTRGVCMKYLNENYFNCKNVNLLFGELQQQFLKSLVQTNINVRYRKKNCDLIYTTKIIYYPQERVNFISLIYEITSGIKKERKPMHKYTISYVFISRSIYRFKVTFPQTFYNIERKIILHFVVQKNCSLVLLLSITRSTASFIRNLIVKSEFFKRVQRTKKKTFILTRKKHT